MKPRRKFTSGLLLCGCSGDFLAPSAIPTVAAAISVFGFNSRAALATVVGVLIEVPVLLLVVKVVNSSKAGRKDHRAAGLSHPSVAVSMAQWSQAVRTHRGSVASGAAKLRGFASCAPTNVRALTASPPRDMRGRVSARRSRLLPARRCRASPASRGSAVPGR